MCIVRSLGTAEMPTVGIPRRYRDGKIANLIIEHSWI